MQPRRRRAPATGYAHRSQAVKRATTSFDADTFAQIRALALASRTSLSEQVRQLVEFGLETLACANDAGARLGEASGEASVKRVAEPQERGRGR